MPPKKKAAASKKRKVGTDKNAGVQVPSHMYLLTLTITRPYECDASHQALFSSRKKAIDAMPAFLDIHCPHSTDWRNGLKGYGQEDEDDYLGYEFKSDGDVATISNRNCTDASGGDLVEAKVEQVPVDPIIEAPPEDDYSEVVASNFF